MLAEAHGEALELLAKAEKRARNRMKKWSARRAEAEGEADKARRRADSLAASIRTLSESRSRLQAMEEARLENATAPGT